MICVLSSVQKEDTVFVGGGLKPYTQKGTFLPSLNSTHSCKKHLNNTAVTGVLNTTESIGQKSQTTKTQTHSVQLKFCDVFKSCHTLCLH